MKDKVLLIDGNSIINRAFYALPLLSSATGEYTNGVYGFLNIFFKLLDEENPQYIGVAFDLPGPTFRTLKFEAYKGTRKGMPEELRPQIPLLKEVLQAMGVPCFVKEGFEADDILGTLSREALDANVLPVVVSGDRDLLQLATDEVKIRIPKTKQGRTETEDYLAKDVVEKYGVTPAEFIDVKALMGDASDNVPGVPGIGEKTAVKIIQQYHTLENALENAASVTPKKASAGLTDNKELALLSKELVTIDRNVPLAFDLDEMKAEIYTPEAYEKLQKLEFKSLLTRFQDVVTQEKQIEFQYNLITTEKEAGNYINSLSQEEETAYFLCVDNSFACAAFCGSDSAVTVLMTSDGLQCASLFAMLKPFFENPSYKKIAHDAKSDMATLKNQGIGYEGLAFDTMIGGYILDSNRDSYGYDDLANLFLQETYPSSERVFGKGKQMKSPSEIPGDAMAQFAANGAMIIARVQKVMAEKLKINKQDHLYYQIELPLIQVLFDMEQAGIRIEHDSLHEYGEELQKNMDKIALEIYEDAGEKFNIQSPKQLGEILFDKMKLKGGKKTKTGYSTAADVLEKLSYVPIVNKILLYRQLAKLKSTYVDGLLQVMNPETSRVYSTFRQTIASTGRLSSTEPNLQNIPIRLALGREIRRVFVPENGYIFVDGDYSQIELRVLAHMAEEETLIKAFNNHEDIHRLTASHVFSVPLDEVTDDMRSAAKTVNFGIIYGMGAFTLSQDLHISRKQADDYINGYFNTYPRIKSFMDQMIADANQKGYAETIFGRRREIPELQSGNFNLRSFGERAAMNMPVQGTAADIIKIAMGAVHRKFNELNLKSRLILQVHDELLIEAHQDEVDLVKRILREEMEQAADLKVDLEVDIHEGANWFEAK